MRREVLNVTRTSTWKKKLLTGLLAAIALGVPGAGSAQDLAAKIEWIGLGYLTTEKQPGLGVITGGSEARLSLAEGDPVYVRLRNPLPSGVKEFGVFRWAGEVRHPRSKKSLGRLVAGIGIMKIEEETFPYAKGVILRSLAEVSPGDWIAPLDLPPQPLAQWEARRSSRKISGTIVALRANRLGVGEEDIVYLDVGNRQGVSAGDRFYVYGARQGSAERPASKTTDQEKQILAELVVLHSQEGSSTARIVKSLSELTVGGVVESAVGP